MLLVEDCHILSSFSHVDKSRRVAALPIEQEIAKGVLLFNVGQVFLLAEVDVIVWKAVKISLVLIVVVLLDVLCKVSCVLRRLKT